MNRHEVCSGHPYKIRMKTLRVQIAPATTYTNAGEYQEPSQVSLRNEKARFGGLFCVEPELLRKKDPQKRFKKAFLRRGEAAARAALCACEMGGGGGACFDEAQANIRNLRLKIKFDESQVV